MPISYNSDLRVFRLDTPRTTYLMGNIGSATSIKTVPMP